MALIPTNIVRFCADECARQKSGEMSVFHMVLAYDVALEMRTQLRFFAEDVVTLGQIVEPVKNKSGYRKVPVTVNGNVLSNQEHIPHQITNLVAHQSILEPDEFYQEFEIIHPFQDGNGRVGAILFNLLNNTIASPIVPPKFVVQPH